MGMPRIRISRTQTEWAAIRENGNKKGIRSAVLRATSSFVKELKENANKSDSIECKRISRQFTIPQEDYNEIVKLAIKLHTPVATVIDQLIISPLLISK